MTSTGAVARTDAEHDTHRPLAPDLFPLHDGIRYIAVNQNGRIVEMTQHPRHSSHNPPDSDRMEELLANPTVLEITKRRGDIDLGGVRYVVIRYGLQFQLVLPWRNGHVSVGVEPHADVCHIATLIESRLGPDA